MAISCDRVSILTLYQEIATAFGLAMTDRGIVRIRRNAAAVSVRYAERHGGRSLQ